MTRDGLGMENGRDEEKIPERLRIWREWQKIVQNKEENCTEKN